MKNIFLKNETVDGKKGFVILFAVLLSSIVLLITLGIASIASNELILSSSAREAQYAFFAADTGAECALYWDKQGLFADPNTPAKVTSGVCDGITVTPLPVFGSGFSYVLNDLDLNSVKQCAMVTIDKDSPPNSVPSGTKIESKGYNVPCQAIGTSSRAIERVVRLTY